MLQFFGGGSSKPPVYDTAPISGHPTLQLGTGTFNGGAAPDFQGTSALGINMAAGYADKLFDYQVAGVSMAFLSAIGTFTPQAITTGGSITGGVVSASSGIQALVPPPNSSAYGLINIGDGAYGGGAVPDFQGSANHSYYTLNAASGFTGQSISLQTAGVKQFEVLGNGALTINPVTGTAAPLAGAADPLPATPAGYATITIGTTVCKIAYY